MTEDVALEIFHAGGRHARIAILPMNESSTARISNKIVGIRPVDVLLVARGAVLQLIPHLVVDADADEQLSFGLDSHV